MSTDTLVREGAAGISDPRAGEFRLFRSDLELVRGPNGTGRTVRGIAVPWDQWIDVYGDGWLYESFRSGAVDHQMDPRSLVRVKLADGHMYRGGKLIGVTTLMRNDAAGLYWEAKVSHTPAGDAAIELAKDSALDQLSVGFREVKGGNELRIDPETGLELQNWVIRTKVNLFEVAMVPEGAYGDGATVEGIRARQDRGTPPARRTEAERALRELGYSDDEVTRALKALEGREDGDELVAAILARLPEV